MRKRLLAIIATAAMVVAMIPAMAFADTYVAEVASTGQKYTSVNEAINAAANNDTVYLYGTISEAIRPWTNPSHDQEKSITIDGKGSAVLTGGMYLGYDDSKTRDHTVVVKGITFEGKGLAVADQLNVTVENNTFKNIAASSEGGALAIIDQNKDSATGKAVIKNNTIDGVAGNDAGIRVRNGYDVTITGNVIKNVSHNAILIEDTCTGSLVISSNQIVNWDSDNDSEGGRAIRTVASGDITITDNKMVKETWADNPTDDDFVKLTSVNVQANVQAEINLNGNYWNSAEPDLDEIITIQGQGIVEDDIIKDIVISTEGIPAPNQGGQGTTLPEASPATGDNSMAPFAVAGLVLAAMAAVVATRRRYN